MTRTDYQKKDRLHLLQFNTAEEKETASSTGGYFPNMQVDDLVWTSAGPGHVSEP